MERWGKATIARRKRGNQQDREHSTEESWVLDTPSRLARTSKVSTFFSPIEEKKAACF